MAFKIELKKIILLPLFALSIIIIISIYGKTIITPEEHIDLDENRSILIQMANGFLLSRALHVAADLNIADQLKSEPKTADQIASTINADKDFLYRLMRMLSAHNVFDESQDNKFSLNSLSKLLLTDNPKTLRNFLAMDDTTRWQAYGNLTESVKTGKTAFELTFNQSFFDYIKDKPCLQNIFDKGMHDISSSENRYIVNKLVIKEPDKTSVVDVGGGTGSLLIELKNKYENLCQTILFDYSPLERQARKLLKKNNIIFKQGSFLDFEDLPKEKDIYILKRVLHDWSDKDSITILENCKKAMASNGKILVIDTVISSGNIYHIGKDIDIVMMALFGGQERTKEQFENLFNKAGLCIANITPVHGTMLSIIDLKNI